MYITFTKMHGIGNDYIYVDCMKGIDFNPSDLAVAMSKRRFSVGADGLVLICASDVADAKMRMFNADGSEGKMCGNAIRCVAKYLYDNKIVDKYNMTIETLSGIKTIGLILDDGGCAVGAEVDMGIASVEPKDLPIAQDLPMIKQKVRVGDLECYLTAVSMGNPHAVCFDCDPSRLDLEAIGPHFENNPLFPERVNTEFAKIDSPTHITMRVWERGSGETLACGTGACATVVAAVLEGYCQRDSQVVVALRGGELVITYTSAGNVIMKGPAATVYKGIYLYEN